MKKVLVLGAGLVSRPLVHYLLDQKNIHVTMASRTKEKAIRIIADHPHGQAQGLNVSNHAELDSLICDHDVIVSLLPYTYHVEVAQICLKYGHHLVTTSYVSDEMSKLHASAEDADILFLNEIGLDPGIDHMSAMKIIHQLQGNGDTIVSFTSYCGVLPAPEANTNPVGYKFSWSPRGVLLASRNSAQYLWDGQEVTIPGEHLFQGYTYQSIPGFGVLEGYPNRNSVLYRDLYGLLGIQTLQRGTLRYMGWCELMKKIGDIGLLSLTDTPLPSDITYRHYISNLTGLPQETLESSLAEYLHIDTYAAVMKKLDWLGLFSTQPVPPSATTPLDVLATRMLEKLQYGPGERDMSVLHHDFIATSTNGTNQVTSTFIGYGDPQGDSAVARTVALPAAIGTKLLLQDKLSLRGVRIPIYPEIYIPVLHELESHGIVFKEHTQKVTPA